ncbi:hypothetical protein JIG36_50775 [Actinoplanes sp. LDG1-06]|uniref:Uncharacterized protein n=1 Tax=Paractinoplanes ovalisporus TaxID=2810368 RepID=A0ABS2AV94_9ACTN|nr:hypothetical protein [Actinoplanes ovalisporus]MBM2623803.1 hypothetical protein [Actinoplanes ovalisporus]
MTMREEAAHRLARLLSPLREEGWLLTPFSTAITGAGVVVLTFRDGDTGLRDDLEQRLNDLDPGLQVESRFSSMTQHVIVRL